MRLASARRRGREPFQRQTEPALEFQPVCNFGLIVRCQREDQRALPTQLDIDTAGTLKLLGKGRPARLTLATERNQRFFTRLGFAAGRQHSGRGMACPRASLAAIEQFDRRAAVSEPPANAEADHAGADDRNLGRFVSRCRAVRQRRLPSLA